MSRLSNILKTRVLLLSFFFNHHFTLVVKFSFEPMSAMEHVWLSGSWAGRHIRSLNFIVSTALGLSGLRDSVFGMCHDFLNNNYYSSS
jgi:hypothetical protein